MTFDQATILLHKREYSVTRVIENNEVKALQVYSSALIMEERESRIRAMLPKFTVTGMKNQEYILIKPKKQ